MSNIVIPDGGNIGSASDTDAITISSTGKVTTADSELNVKTTSHTFTVKGINEAIGDSQSGTTPDTTDSDSGQFAVYNGSTKLLGITEHGYVLKPNQIISSYKLQHSSCATGTVIRGANSSTALVNRGNCFDNSNGKFTAPVAGAYLFALNIGLGAASNSNTWYGFAFYINGTITGHIIYEHINSTHDNQANLMGGLDLSAGDYVEIRTGMNGTVTLYINYLAYLLG